MLALLKSSFRPDPDTSRPRKRLAELQAAMGAQRDRSIKLFEHVQAADDAAAAEREALEALEAIAELEQADWRIWGVTGSGSPPRPRTAERELVATHLAECHAATIEAQTRANAVQVGLEEARVRYCDLAEQHLDHIATVLIEEAQSLADLYTTSVRRTLLCEAALHGLRDALVRLGRGADSARVRQMLAGAEPHEVEALRKTVAAEIATELSKWATLADRLSTDATATLSVGD